MANLAHRTVALTRWQGSQHPNLQNITRALAAEGLSAYRWQNGPNFRHPLRSHTFDKVLYCIQGSVEIDIPDYAQRILLRAGDRIELPAGVRYAQAVGPDGVQCIESRRAVQPARSGS